MAVKHGVKYSSVLWFLTWLSFYSKFCFFLSLFLYTFHTFVCLFVCLSGSLTCFLFPALVFTHCVYCCVLCSSTLGVYSGKPVALFPSPTLLRFTLLISTQSLFLLGLNDTLLPFFPHLFFTLCFLCVHNVHSYLLIAFFALLCFS